MIISAADALAYQTRWKSVNQMEIAELRNTSMEMKLRQLASLMASREMFGIDPQRERATEQIRERWVQLRQALSE